MFLLNRPQVVKIGDNLSSSVTLSTGTPEGCVLSPMLYSLFTHDCLSCHVGTKILKFADDIYRGYCCAGFYIIILVKVFRCVFDSSVAFVHRHRTRIDVHKCLSTV